MTVLRRFARRVPFVRPLYQGLLTARAAGPDPFAMKLFLTVRPYTMVTEDRIRNIYDLASDLEKRGVRGAFVECGVWRGGCAAVMAAVAKRARSGRLLWLFDSFEGLPEPTEKDGQMAAEYSGTTRGELRPIERLVAPLDDVRTIMGRLGIDPATVVVRKGWFQDTLPAARSEIGPIALLRLDGDWYESTKVCLQNLYDEVVPGGHVVFDDYDYWEGCRRAVDEFLAERGIQTALQPVHRGGFADGRYLTKTEGTK